jgi:hypothetical protein
LNWFDKWAILGQAGISDHLLPIFIDHITILAINKMRWSSRSGEGWSKPAFLPIVFHSNGISQKQLKSEKTLNNF